MRKLVLLSFVVFAACTKNASEVDPNNIQTTYIVRATPSVIRLIAYFREKKDTEVGDFLVLDQGATIQVDDQDMDQPLDQTFSYKYSRTNTSPTAGDYDKTYNFKYVDTAARTFRNTGKAPGAVTMPGPPGTVSKSGTTLTVNWTTSDDISLLGGTSVLARITAGTKTAEKSSLTTSGTSGSATFVPNVDLKDHPTGTGKLSVCRYKDKNADEAPPGGGIVEQEYCTEEVDIVIND